MHLATNGGSMITYTKTDLPQRVKFGLTTRLLQTSSAMPKLLTGTGSPMTLKRKMHSLFICQTNLFYLKESE